MQRRVGSLIEAIASTLVGFCVSLVLTVLVLPAFGYAVTAPDAVGITAIYTGASVLRSYVVRRVFDGAAWSKTEADKS